MLDIYYTRKAYYSAEGELYAYAPVLKNKTSKDMQANILTKEDILALKTLYEAMGSQELSGNNVCLVPFARWMLGEVDMQKMFPSAMSVFVVSGDAISTIKGHDDIVELKMQGFTVCTKVNEIEDFENRTLTNVDAVIVDFDTKDTSKQEALCKLAKQKGKVLIAENLRNYTGYMRAVEQKCDLFEGRYFKMANAVFAKRHPHYPIGFTLESLLEYAGTADPQFMTFATTLNRDVAVSYRFVEYANLLTRRETDKFTSVFQAAVAFDTHVFREWVYLGCFQSPYQGKTDEHVKTALIRARFLRELHNYIDECELSKDELHMLGLVSMLGLIMNTKTEEVIKDIPIRESISDAISIHFGVGGLLLELVEAYESAKWSLVGEIENKLEIKKGAIIRSYFTAQASIDNMWASVVKIPD